MADGDGTAIMVLGMTDGVGMAIMTHGIGDGVIPITLYTMVAITADIITMEADIAEDMTEIMVAVHGVMLVPRVIATLEHHVQALRGAAGIEHPSHRTATAMSSVEGAAPQHLHRATQLHVPNQPTVQVQGSETRLHRVTHPHAPTLQIVRAQSLEGHVHQKVHLTVLQGPTAQVLPIHPHHHIALQAVPATPQVVVAEAHLAADVQVAEAAEAVEVAEAVAALSVGIGNLSLYPFSSFS